MKRLFLLLTFIFILSAFYSPRITYAADAQLAPKASITVIENNHGILTKIAKMFSRIVDSIAELAREIKTFIQTENKITEKTFIHPKPIQPVALISAKPVEMQPSSSVIKPDIIREDNNEPLPQPSKKIDISFSDPEIQQPEIEQNTRIDNANIVIQPAPEKKIETFQPSKVRQIISEPVSKTVSMPISIVSARDEKIAPAPLVALSRPVNASIIAKPQSVKMPDVKPISRTGLPAPQPVTQIKTRVTAMVPVVRIADARLMTRGEFSKEEVSVCVEEFESEIEGEIANVKITDDQKHTIILTQDGRAKKIYAISNCSGDMLECGSEIETRMQELESICSRYQERILPSEEENSEIVTFVKRLNDRLTFVYDNVFYLLKGRYGLLVELDSFNSRDGKIYVRPQIMKINEQGVSDCLECKAQYSLKDSRGTDISALLDGFRGLNAVIVPPLRYSSVQMIERGEGAENITINLTLTDPITEKSINTSKVIKVIYQ